MQLFNFFNIGYFFSMFFTQHTNDTEFALNNNNSISFLNNSITNLYKDNTTMSKNTLEPSQSTTILNSISQAQEKYEEAISISKWQRQIDGAALKKAGIKFVNIRSTDGATYQDPKFEDFFKNITDNGILAGAWHIFRTETSTPHEQFKNIKTQLHKAGFDKNKNPIAISVTSTGIKDNNPKEAAKNLNKLITLLKMDGFENICIYTNNGDWNSKIDSKSYDFSENCLFISHWNADKPNVPETWKDVGWSFWENTCKGHGRWNKRLCMYGSIKPRIHRRSVKTD